MLNRGRLIPVGDHSGERPRGSGHVVATSRRHLGSRHRRSVATLFMVAFMMAALAIPSHASAGLAGVQRATALTAERSAPSFQTLAGVANLFHPSCRARYRLEEDRTRGVCVQRIQTILNRSREAGLSVDGSYGPRTEAAVRRYQSARGLQADGVAGPATLLKLEFESGSRRDRVLSYALKAQRGHAMGNSTLGRWNGGSIAYGSDTGGGHGTRPGPSGVDSPWSPDPNDGFIDCSGFTRWSFSLGFGYSGEQNPHARWTTGDIAAEAPRTSTLRPGDLVVWRRAGGGHVVLYLGGGEVVHSLGNGPRTDRLVDLDARFAGFSRTQHTLFGTV